MSGGGVTADPLAAGRAALRAARWQEARERLEAAPALGESPEALEDLSWAAWWLDDGEAVFAAREAAYRLYRRRGDPAGAARMAIWLAADQLDFRGAWPVASGWLQRAHRLLDTLDPRPEHGWLAFHEGYLAHAARDTATATELAGRVTELGRRFDVPDLEMLGLALQGSTLVSCGRVAEGMRCLDEATATALGEEAAIPISGAWTFCFLVGACTSVLDFERASAWCDRIAAFADRYGSRYMLAFCRAEYGAVQVWRGRWEDAERLLEASVEDFAAARPAWVAGPLAGLAELRRRQGRAQDAERLLDRAGASSNAQLCRVRLALDEGRPQRAVELLERVLRGLPPDRALDRAPVLELVVRARVAAGELDQAESAMAQLRAVQREAGTTALAACADAAEGVLAEARGDRERARALLEDAVDGFERSGAPYEAARARLELAGCLHELGRDDAAAREAAAALERLLALGAEPEAGRARRLLARASGGSGPLEELTAREREVLRLVADGLTNRQIAARLVLSEHTVHRHVANLLRKLGLPSRTAAAARAARAGLLR
jgi:LuxR family transcriptional regulator, maltose regulon positive regulatory protein